MSIADLARSWDEKIGAIQALIEQHRHNASQTMEARKRHYADFGTVHMKEKGELEVGLWQRFEADLKILQLEVKQVLES